MPLSSPSEPENALAPSLPDTPLILGGLWEKAVWYISILGIDVLFVGTMSLILGIVLIRHKSSIRIAEASVLYPIGMMFFLLLTRSALWLYRHLKNQNEGLSIAKLFLQTLRDWIPFILISFIYENLHDLSRLFHTHDIAGTLMNWDIRIFGVEPTVWSQKIFSPLLTDLMAFSYALYFFLPLGIMYFLSYRNLRNDLREMILALSISFLIGFLGYAFFPCSPPRYYLENQFTQPPHLYGLYLYNYLQGQWDSHSVIRAGAFPSLHVTTSAIALIYARRFRIRSRFDRILYWVYIPLVVSLWYSTIYLRHHWFIDIIAGYLLATFSCWIAPILERFWRDLRERERIPGENEAVSL